MAATLTSTGTWTVLVTPTGATSSIARTERNDPRLINIDQADFRTLPSEVTQTVQLWADGYNISYWAACVLLNKMLTAHLSKAAPTAA
jgi:hypothetical protein